MKILLTFIVAMVVVAYMAPAQYTTYPDAAWIVGGSTQPTVGAVFTSNPRYAISAHQNGTLKVWDTETGLLVRYLAVNLPQIRAVEYSPKHDLLVLGLGSGEVRLLDGTTGKTVRSLMFHQLPVECVELSHDESLLASGGVDTKIALWNFPGGDTVATFNGGREKVTGVDISPDNSMLAAGNYDFAVRVWDVATREQTHEFVWSQKATGAVRFTGDNSMLLATNYYTEWLGSPPPEDPLGGKLFDLATGDSVASFRACPCQSMELSPDFQTLLVACKRHPENGQRGRILRFDMQKMIQGHYERNVANYTLKSFGSPLNQVQFSRDGMRVIAAAENNGVYVESLETLVFQNGADTPFHFHDSLHLMLAAADAAASIGQLETVAFGARNGQILMLEEATGSLQTMFTRDGWAVRSLVPSPDGSRIASCAMDGAVKLWNTSTGELEKTLYGSADHSINDAAFSPDGLNIVGAIGPFDNRLVMWDTSSPAPLRMFEGHTDGLWSVVWSPDGTTIASAGDDATVRIWNAATGELRATLTDHRSKITSLALSPDGTRLASASTDKTIRLWAMPSGDNLLVLRGHDDFVNSIDFTPDGNFLVSGSMDGTIRVWDVTAGIEVFRYDDYPYSALSVDVSNDGRHIAAGYDDGSLIQWRFRSVSRVDGVDAAAARNSITAFPNPFADKTDIVFVTATAGRVSVDVYDARGTLVAPLFAGDLAAGEHTLRWDATLVPACAYFCMIRSGGRQFATPIVRR